MLFGLFLLTPITTEAQILKKIGKKIKKRADKKVDKTIDKGLDEVEDEIDGNNKEKSPNEQKDGKKCSKSRDNR